MGIEQQDILRLVRMMLRGISTDKTIDPLTAAGLFDTALDDLDLFFIHDDGAGYVTDGVEPVMYAEFSDDGVSFDDHHEHPQTLHVIRCALQAITDAENAPADDDSDDDWDWV